MATYRELVHMVLDELKVASDDSFFQEEHIMFLLDKFRAFLLKQRYSDIRKEIPDSNYQTICVDLETTMGIEDAECVGNTYLKSIDKIPYMMPIGSTRISAMDLFSGNFTYTSNERFKYAGNNMRLKNEIYGTIAPDQYLYMKSSNPQAYYLEKVKITGIFEDSEKASELQCPDEAGETPCDILDNKFPIEDGLIPPLIELVVKEIGSKLLQPEDTVNNANDDLGDLASYIARHIKKRRSKYDSDDDA